MTTMSCRGLLQTQQEQAGIITLQCNSTVMCWRMEQRTMQMLLLAATFNCDKFIFLRITGSHNKNDIVIIQ